MHGDGSLYIHTLYVSKEKRGKSQGVLLERLLIKKEKPTMIFCDIELKDENCSRNVAAFIMVANYKIDSANEERIILFKDLR